MSGHPESGLGLMHPGAQPKSSSLLLPAQGNSFPPVQSAPESFRSSWQKQLASLLVTAGSASDPSATPGGLTETSATSASASQLLPAKTSALLPATSSSAGIIPQSRLSAKTGAAQDNPSLSGIDQQKVSALPAQIPASRRLINAQLLVQSEATDSLETQHPLHSAARKQNSTKNTSWKSNLVEKAHELTGQSLESASLILPAPIATPVRNAPVDESLFPAPATSGSQVFSAYSNGSSRTAVPPIPHNETAPLAQSKAADTPAVDATVPSEIEASEAGFSGTPSPGQAWPQSDQEISQTKQRFTEIRSGDAAPAFASIPAPVGSPVSASKAPSLASPLPQALHENVEVPNSAHFPNSSPNGSSSITAPSAAVSSPVTLDQGLHIQTTTSPKPNPFAQNQIHASSAITVSDSAAIPASSSQSEHQVRTSGTNAPQLAGAQSFPGVSSSTPPARTSNTGELAATKVLSQHEQVPTHRADLPANGIIARPFSTSASESEPSTASAQPTAGTPLNSRDTGSQPLLPEASMPNPVQLSDSPLGRQPLPSAASSLPRLPEAIAAPASQVETALPRQLSGLSKPSGPALSRTVHESASISTSAHLLHPLQVPAGNPTGDAPALVRDLSGTHGATISTSTISRSSTATAAPNGEPFATLDSGTALGTPAWVHAGSRRAEAGFQDPSLGWVGVRADSSGGLIHATLLPGTTDAAQALDGHLAGLHSYLSDVHTPVESLTLAAPESRGSSLATGQQQGQGMNQGANQNAGQGGASESPAHSVSAPHPTAAASSPDQRATIINPGNLSPDTYRQSGAHISVIA